MLVLLCSSRRRHTRYWRDWSSDVCSSDLQEVPGPAVCDVAHFASEWPWLPVAADVLSRDLSGRVEVAVSTRRTDPWTAHAGVIRRPDLQQQGSARARGEAERVKADHFRSQEHTSELQSRHYLVCGL